MGQSLDLSKAEVYARLQSEGGVADAEDASATDASATDAEAATDETDAGTTPWPDAGGAGADSDASSTVGGDNADAAAASPNTANSPCPVSTQISAYVWLRYSYWIDPSEIGTPEDEGLNCLYPIQGSFCSE